MKNKTKVLAYYLPQFHEIPENNEWWGKGFTEWTNVKRARPLFPGQVQPRVPLNNNYYNILDKQTVEWQTELANKYGVYGFCYFHYYFKDGKKVLEKPAENLLKWSDINQRYCFFWANSPWIRTWSAAAVSGGTTWVSEEREGKGKTGILLEQDYGDEACWKEHFDYLLPFFEDERYIKIDGKPFFAIYFVNQIPCAKEMFLLWDKLAKRAGFPGIFISAVNGRYPSSLKDLLDGNIQYGGGCYDNDFLFHVKAFVQNRYRRYFSKDSHRAYSYDEVWRAILRQGPYGGINNFPGGVVDSDDSPRRGVDCTYLKGASPQKFYRYLSKQLIRTRDFFHSEYLFLNAWNEWGEGCYLEPDEHNGYAYLEALKRALVDTGNI
ncbi:MAG: glycoside hydrolase family 99-like domain-containing protein [Lachnospiraceae bacterium]|nr:glycoside hydrolase family 99-like domain-containing protein [Lachnospiraceae bacterium]